jgi:hypothetical protein
MEAFSFAHSSDLSELEVHVRMYAPPPLESYTTLEPC